MVGEKAEMILELFFNAFFVQKTIQRRYLRGHFRVGIEF